MTITPEWVVVTASLVSAALLVIALWLGRIARTLDGILEEMRKR